MPSRRLLHAGILRLMAVMALTSLADLARSDEGPAAWSPDARWITYVLPQPSAEEEDSTPVRTGWSLDPWSITEAPAPILDAKPGSGRSAVWATRVEDRVSTRLLELPGRLAVPAWRSDGRALVVASLRPATQPDATQGGPSGPGPADATALEGGTHSPWVYEVIELTAGRATRSLLRRELPSRPDEAWAGWPGRRLAWSPDGRWIVAPSPERTGLVLIDALDGTLRETLPEATLPSWAPTVEPLRLAYFQAGDETGLYLLDLEAGTRKRIAREQPGGQPPAWSRSGDSLVVTDIKAVPRLIQGGRTELAEARYFYADGRPLSDRNINRTQSNTISLETFDWPEGVEGLDRPRIQGAWYLPLPDGESAYFTVAAPDHDQALTSYVVAKQSRLDRFAPLDPGLAMTDLTIAPDGRFLALRFRGRRGPSGLGLIRIEDRKHDVIPILPDAAQARAWQTLLVERIRDLLDEGLRTATFGQATDRPARRPWLWPLPGDVPGGQSQQRARSLARFGLEQLGPTRTQEPVESREARWVFLYLLERYEEAEAVLDGLPRDELALEQARAGTLHFARAMLAAGQEDTARAEALIDALLDNPIIPDRQPAFERTPLGPALSDHDTLAREAIPPSESANPGGSQPSLVSWDEAFRAWLDRRRNGTADAPESQPNDRIPLDAFDDPFAQPRIRRP